MRAVLIARIYGVFPLLCPLCGGQMRLLTRCGGSADDVVAHVKLLLDGV